MYNWKNYLQPKTLEETFNYIEKADTSFYLVAGGTDLLLEIQQGRRTAMDTLVDLNGLQELTVLEICENRLLIGAGVPVSRIATSELVLKHASALAEATGLIGGPQVRNVATLGGNVAHALPAADGMIALVAMDAHAVVASRDRVEEIPILQLFNGPGVSSLNKNQLIVAFKINVKGEGEGSAFSRIMRPQGVALPILNLAVWVRRKQKQIVDIRVTFGPSGPVPSRALEIETILRGNQLGEELLEDAVAAISSTIKFRSSKNRASSEYRYQIAGPLFKNTFRTAWQRAEVL